MNLNQHGVNTSQSEVTSIGPFGFWILSDNAEYFVPFKEYPIFKTATIKQIFNMKRLSPTQFYWPEIDADIEIEALASPEKFPLIWNSGTKMFCTKAHGMQ
jgi:hypothetical protein